MPRVPDFPRCGAAAGGPACGRRRRGAAGTTAHPLNTCYLHGLPKPTSQGPRARLCVAESGRPRAAQDYIPPEELAGLLASGGSEAARAQAAALEAAQRIGEDNIGHRMLRGMGWVEGTGLGAAATGRAAPLAAGAAKAAQDKIGLGAAVRRACLPRRCSPGRCCRAAASVLFRACGGARMAMVSWSCQSPYDGQTPPASKAGTATACPHRCGGGAPALRSGGARRVLSDLGGARRRTARCRRTTTSLRRTASA